MLWVNLHSLRLRQNLMTALTNQLCEGSVMEKEGKKSEIQCNQPNPVHIHYLFEAKTTQKGNDPVVCSSDALCIAILL